MDTCTLGDRTYKLHTITLPSSEPHGDTTTISCLLSPDFIHLLPTPLPCTSKSSSTPIYSIRQTPNKGVGIFAARAIEVGELIMVEHPALILPTGKFAVQVYDELAARLPKKRREELLTMANARSRKECESAVEGIVRTNALMLELDPKGLVEDEKKEIYGGVYPLINRANHSCGPNAAIKWNHAALSLSLYALRSIAAGEEICKTYVNPALPRETRMNILSKNYRFTCDCPWCNIRRSVLESSAPGDFTTEELEQIAMSDRDRALLGSWIFTRPGYKKWSTDLARADDLVISSHLEALALIEKEGMHGLQNLFIEEIAMSYAILGDINAFKDWGTQLVKLARVEDPELARQFEDWLVDPKGRMKKWAWRKRQREQRPGRRNTSRCEDNSPLMDVDAFHLLFQ